MNQLLNRLVLPMFAAQKIPGPHRTTAYRLTNPDQNYWVRRMLESAMYDTYARQYVIPASKGLALATSMYGIDYYPTELRETWILCGWNKIIASFALRIFYGPGDDVLYIYSQLIDPTYSGLGLARWVIHRVRAIYPNVRFIFYRTVNASDITTLFSLVDFTRPNYVPLLSDQTSQDLATTTDWFITDVEGLQFGTDNGQVNLNRLIYRRGEQIMGYSNPSYPWTQRLFTEIGLNNQTAAAGDILYCGIDMNRS